MHESPGKPSDAHGAAARDQRTVGRAPIVHAVNRCPRCAYRLDGLRGVPEEAYAPFTNQASCPECGLVIPVGARCVVGASSQGRVDPREGRVFNDARLALLLALVFVEGLVLTWAVLRWGGGVFTAFTPVLLSLPVLATLLVFSLRRSARAGSLDSDGMLGGADVRFLFEPGILRIYAGSRQAPAESCTGLDVHRVSATTQWRFFPKPHLPTIFLLRVQVPSSFKRAGSFGAVLCYLHAPRARLPSDLAREFTLTLRAKPGEGAVVPPIRATPTPSAPPKCPLCGRPLLAAAANEGEWSRPLSGTVSCPSCSMTIPAGAFVLCGGAQPTELMAPAQRKLVWVMIVGSMLAAGAFVLAVVFIAPWSLPVFFGCQLVFMSLAIGMPFLIRRMFTLPSAPRPAGRFQSSSLVWVIEPGFLTIVARRRSWLAKRATRQRIPSAGISRIEFLVGEPETNYAVGTDALVARGTAPALGLLGRRTIMLSVYSGIDRDEFAVELTRTLKKRAGGAV